MIPKSGAKLLYNEIRVLLPLLVFVEGVDNNNSNIHAALINLALDKFNKVIG